MGFLKVMWALITSKEQRRYWGVILKATYNAARKRKYDVAIAQLNEFLNSGVRDDRQKCHALTLLGQIHIWKGEYEKAKDHLEEALDLSLKTKKRSSELCELLGYVHFKTGDWRAALKFLRLACEYAGRGFVNRFYAKYLGNAEERKRLLERDKDLLPFLGAYYKQNRHKFESPSEPESD
jgi:tetratricopeptide (TPR) repeat protein